MKRMSSLAFPQAVRLRFPLAQTSAPPQLSSLVVMLNCKAAPLRHLRTGFDTYP